MKNGILAAIILIALGYSSGLNYPVSNMTERGSELVAVNVVIA